jgi:hypothetical protein
MPRIYHKPSVASLGLAQRLTAACVFCNFPFLEPNRMSLKTTVDIIDL